jgi:phage anti-repressor protein
MNFKDFLIKYTTINSQFIEDFSELIKEDYIEKYNDFLIDSEILRKWLKITTHKEFKQTLVNSYKVNVDYKLKKIEKKIGSGGHNKKIFILTPEAAKKICLMTKSKVGDDVRQYFLDLELALYKYKNHIIESLNKKIEQLENNNKPKVNASKGIIYVFRALNTENATLYKIGKTINSKKRFNSHNSPLANNIEIIMTYEADNLEQLESCVKNYMKKSQYRKYKEIYQVDIDIIRSVIKDCDTKLKEINDIIDKKNKRLKGGKTELKNITESDKIFMLIPNKNNNN